MTLPSLHPDSLRNIPLFAGLSQPDSSALLQLCHVRNLAGGAHLFRQGDTVGAFFIVLEGTIQLFRATPDGHEKTIDLLHIGQMMGVGEIMDSCNAYRTYARAVNASRVLEFPAASLKEMARRHGAVALNLLWAMSTQAHEAALEAEHQATMSAAQLVACFMQRLCILFGFNPAGFELPYSKTLIASRLGMEIETFSRTLHKLRDNGIVVDGNHVSITDIDLINQYVCESCSISRECVTHQKLAQLSPSHPTQLSGND